MDSFCAVITKQINLTFSTDGMVRYVSVCLSWRYLGYTSFIFAPAVPLRAQPLSRWAQRQSLESVLPSPWDLVRSFKSILWVELEITLYKDQTRAQILRQSVLYCITYQLRTYCPRKIYQYTLNWLQWAVTWKNWCPRLQPYDTQNSSKISKLSKIEIFWEPQKVSMIHLIYLILRCWVWFWQLILHKITRMRSKIGKIRTFGLVPCPQDNQSIYN